MKLITDNVMKTAQRLAISSRADDIETKVVGKLKNVIVQPNIEEKLIAMLTDKPNADLSVASIIRNAQSVVNVAFKNRADYTSYSKGVYEAIELLALSLVVADEDMLENQKS
jgi:hypothetical protein